jgi:hypothetical protein
MVTEKKKEEVIEELKRLNANLEKIAMLLEEFVVTYRRVHRKEVKKALAEERP